MLGKKLINAGPVGSSGPTPSNYFNTVLYTGNGGTQRIGGYINRGAVFNGSSSYIYNTSTSLWSSNITISAWFRTTDNAQRHPIANIGKGSWTDGFELQVPSANTVGFSFSEGTKYGYFNSSIDLNDGNFHHYVQVSNSTTAKFYIDGVEQTGITTGNGNSRQGSGIRIGRFFQTPEQWAKGTIDQVRIFDKELSSNEVTTLYGETHASTTKSTTDIFDDNSGVALYQLDGNANDTGGVSGYIGEGAIFNGNNSVIKTGVTTPLNNDFSWSFWIKDFQHNGHTTDNSVFTNYQNNYAWLNITSGNVVSARTRASNNTNVDVQSSALDFSNWLHVVFTSSISGGNKLYVNGSLVDEDTTSMSSRNNLSYGGSIWIGNNPADPSSTNYNIDAKIDQVRIYDKVLSSSEVSTLYGETASSNITISDLVAYYPMEGDSLDAEGSYNGTDTNVEYNYSGTATNVTYQEATNFSPDLVWIKSRNASASHVLSDSVRGANLKLRSNSTAAEAGTDYGVVTSFDSNGFSVGGTIDTGDANYLNRTYVAWCFNAGTDAAVSNTDGSITSTVKANQDAGFSIVTTTTNASGYLDFGHGLGVEPNLVIFKDRENTDAWYVYHSANTANPRDVSLILNTNAANYTAGGADKFVPSTDVFHSGNSVSGWSYFPNHNFIAYCFAEVDGIQKVGSYTGNGGSNMIETGFEPAFVMIKKTNNTTNSHWQILDNKRNTSNPRDKELFASTSGAEVDINRYVNFTSNGFELTSASYTNDNNDTYIYLAIAADPDTTTPTVEDSFEVVTYTGNGGTQSIDTGFKPDLVWIKDRTNANSHILQDSIRGANKALLSNATNAEITSTDFFTSFDSNGFTLPPNTGQQTNKLNNNYVAWCWKAGDHDDNLPQINTEGTIDSVVSVNDAAGFSIVKYRGNSTAGATVGHGLSSAPDLIIAKGIDSTSAYNWMVYSSGTGENKHAYLNLTNQFEDPAGGVVSIWNDTAPTSTVFSISDNVNINANGDYIAYCFTSITGYQKIGSYSGGSSGSSNVITTGFKPKFLLVKRTDASGDAWQMFDSVRGGGDTFDNYVQANTSAAEVSYNQREVNFTANGFYWTYAESGTNISGGTYIYLAIA